MELLVDDQWQGEQELLFRLRRAFQPEWKATSRMSTEDTFKKHTYLWISFEHRFSFPKFRQTIGRLGFIQTIALLIE